MPNPYLEFENTPLWVLLDQELAALEANNDLRLTTAREYVIGSLCKRIAPLNLLWMRHALREWRVLRAEDWPPGCSESERLEIAVGIAGVVENGTETHVADALRAIVAPAVPVETLLPIARLLIAAHEASRDGSH